MLKITFNTSAAIYRSPGVEVREFSDAELSCEFKTENDENPRIEWKKVDKDVSFVYFNNSFIGPFHGRAEIKGATVRLHKVTQKDAGKYRCEVTAPKDHVSLGEVNVTLTVLVPPQAPSCDVPSSALTGSLVQLRCRDHHSIPAAVYTWYKDNKPLAIKKPNATYTIDEKTGVLVSIFYLFSKNRLLVLVLRSRVTCERVFVMCADDLNVAAVISGVLLLALLLFLCAFGVFYAHRHGLFSRESFWIPQCHGAAHISSQNLHRTEHIQNAGYSLPPKEVSKISD
uniref:Junctional adhesion molecule 2a n=1 Tax=Cyprinus carpio TaxID=7962 RepID=A0A8C1X4Y9_CYPCA